MKDPELIQEEFGEDMEADSFEFDLETSEEFDSEAWAESPQDEASGMSISNAALALSRQLGAPSHRQQSGRWMRRGNTVVLFGI